MRILIVTDAWKPQVNGVVRTIGCVRDELQKMGHCASIIFDRGADTVTLMCPPQPPAAVVAESEA